VVTRSSGLLHHRDVISVSIVACPEFPCYDKGMSENEVHEETHEKSHDTTAEPPAEEDAAEADEDSGSAAEPAASETGETTARRRGSGAIAWLALLLAVTAAGLAARPYWSQWIPIGSQKTTDKALLTAAEFQTLTDRVENIGAKVERNSQAIDESLQGLEDLEADLKAGLRERPTQDFSGRADRLATRLERLEGEYNTRFGGVRSRVEDLEERVGRRLEQFRLRLADAGAGAERTDQDLATRLRLVEVDSLFALAQDQLALSDNADAARKAWRRGLERLTALEGSRFDDLKRIARREFDKLEAFRPPDTAADIDRLYTIVDEVGDWPARAGKSSESEQAQAQASETSSAGWRDRLGGVLAGLVTIESVDGEYVSPAEVDLERERVQTNLQAAALALVRARQDTAQRLIQRVLARAELHFDTNDEAVEESLQRLSDLVARDDRERRAPLLEESRAEIARLLGSAR